MVRKVNDDFWISENGKMQDSINSVVELSSISEFVDGVGIFYDSDGLAVDVYEFRVLSLSVFVINSCVAYIVGCLSLIVVVM